MHSQPISLQLSPLHLVCWHAVPHERSAFPSSYEPSPSHATAREAYEQNHAELMELMGRIYSRLEAKYRTEQPRGWEHVGREEELVAMLYAVVDYLREESI